MRSPTIDPVSESVSQSNVQRMLYEMFQYHTEEDQPTYYRPDHRRWQLAVRLRQCQGVGLEEFHACGAGCRWNGH